MKQLCCDDDVLGRSSSLENEIEEIEEEQGTNDGYVRASELFEIDNRGGLATIKEGHEVETSTLYSFDFHDNGNAVVYVVVGNSNKISKETSMDALLWTLKNVVVDPSSTIVFLIHIYPQTKYIPTPCKIVFSFEFRYLSITCFLYVILLCWLQGFTGNSLSAFDEVRVHTLDPIGVCCCCMKIFVKTSFD